MTQRLWVCLMLALGLAGLALGNMDGPSPEPAWPKTCQQRARAKLEAATQRHERSLDWRLPSSPRADAGPCTNHDKVVRQKPCQHG
jgi:hypothetical protein